MNLVTSAPAKRGLLARLAGPLTRAPSPAAATVPPLFTVRFLRADRCAEPSLIQDGLRDALEIMLAFKRIAPGIVVERDGNRVAETRNGRLIHPSLDDQLEVALEQEHPPEISYCRAAQLLGAYQGTAAQLETAHRLELPMLCTRLLALEATLLAHAARDGLDLEAQGYRSAQALIDEHRAVAPRHLS